MDRSTPTDPGIVRTLVLEAVLIDLIQRLAARGVRPLLLKGPAFARWLYDDPSIRTYEDLDLLLPVEDIETARRVLTELGFDAEREAALHVHERAPHHETWMRAGALPAVVELHHTLHLIEAPPEQVWARFSHERGRITIGGCAVEVPGPAASALVVVLHAAQHGSTREKSLEDLRRALSRVGIAQWSAAARLAAQLAAGPAFAAGLRLTREGAALIEQLDITSASSDRGLRLLSEGAPEMALGIERLVVTRGVRARCQLLVRELAPSRAFMISKYELAARGRVGLAAAYLLRPWLLALRLPQALYSWISAVRS